MSDHSHNFVENYTGLVGFGFDRETNENTIVYYLQKFSDDALIDTLIKRLGDDELERLFDLMSTLLKKHLSETEYHRLFMKDS